VIDTTPTYHVSAAAHIGRPPIRAVDELGDAAWFATQAERDLLADEWPSPEARMRVVLHRCNEERLLLLPAQVAIAEEGLYAATRARLYEHNHRLAGNLRALADGYSLTDGQRQGVLWAARWIERP